MLQDVGLVRASGFQNVYINSTDLRAKLFLTSADDGMPPRYRSPAPWPRVNLTTRPTDVVYY